jgi:hypothetical protein
MSKFAARGLRTQWCIAASAAMALCWSAPASAGDKGFQPGTVEIWVARTMAIANIARDDDPGGRDPGETMLAACKGLQGEQMSHEWGKVPTWAVKGQAYVCEGYKAFAKAIPGSGKCKLLQQGLDFFGQANPATDPPEVTSAVAAVTATGRALLSAIRSTRRGC